MTNFLEETKEAIKQSGHTVDDVTFIGSEETGHQCTWEEFEILADVDYNAGFGAQCVADDLIIVFKDGKKMYRSEYDGSEWWEFSTPFKKPNVKLKIDRLIGNYWPSLSKLHDEDCKGHNWFD